VAGRLISVGVSLTGHTSVVFSVAFSSDGRVRLWDVSDLHHPVALGTLTGHTNPIESVAFSPDGHTLATGNDDYTARVWETNPDKTATRICATVWPTITKNEWDYYLTGLPYQPPCP
jgi:WD40 repeat protein